MTNQPNHTGTRPVPAEHETGAEAWNQPYPTPTPPTARLPLAPAALTDEGGWFRSATFQNIWVVHEIWYNFSGTIIRVNRPTSLRADLALWSRTPREWDAWVREPDATGARNTERIFEAEAWAWRDYVTQVRGL